jgi:hypothetical protein
MELDKIFCQASIDAYRGRYGEVKDVLQNSKFIDTGNVEFLIGEYKNYLIVSFEGSRGNEDWRRNLDAFRKVKILGGIKIHNGFFRQFKEVRGQLAEEILKYTKKDILVFTGHSQGGALATLSAYFMDVKVFAKYGLPLLVTFGSPRVGNRKFAKNFLKKTIDSRRYVNTADSVTILPPVWLGYKHIKNKVKIGKIKIWERLVIPYPIRKIFGIPWSHYPAKEYLKNMS